MVVEIWFINSNYVEFSYFIFCDVENQGFTSKIILLMLEMSKTDYAVCAVSRAQEIVWVNSCSSGEGTRKICSGKIRNLIPQNSSVLPFYAEWELAERLWLIRTENHRGKNRCPKSVFIPNGGLRYVSAFYLVPAYLPYVFLLVVTFIGIKGSVKRGSEHVGGKILGVLSREGLFLPVTVVFRNVPVARFIFRDRKAGGRGDEPAGLVCGILAHYHKRYLSGRKHGESLLSAYELTARGEYA